MARATRVVNYLDFLRDLGNSDNPYFLEGGQAVNFWAEFYSVTRGMSALSRFVPFTSKDCDIWIGWPVMKFLESKPSGVLLKSDSPADGQIGIFRIGGKSNPTVDLMGGVYGIKPSENGNLLARAPLVNGVRVIDPLNLFRSKCHCLLGLDQTGRQDEKHLRMLCLILPAHLAALLDEAESGALVERQFLNEIKLLLKFCSMNRCRRALERISASREDLFPVAAMNTSGLPLVAAFTNATWPPP